MHPFPGLCQAEQLSLFEELGVNSIIVNENRVIEFVGNQVLSLFNVLKEDMIGENCLEIIGDGRDLFSQCISQVIKEHNVNLSDKISLNGEVYNLKCVLLKPEGNKYLVTFTKLETEEEKKVDKLENNVPFLNEYGIFLKMFKELPVGISLFKINNNNEFIVSTHNDQFKKNFLNDKKKDFISVFPDFPMLWLKEKLNIGVKHKVLKYKDYILKQKNKSYTLYITSITESILMVTTIDTTENLEVQRSVINTIYDHVEKERSRFSRELHDGLGSLLSSVSMRLNVLKSGKLSEDKIPDIISHASDLVCLAINTTKNIAQGLKPYELKDKAFHVAVISFFENIQKTSGLEIRYKEDEFNVELDEKIEVQLYRIISELITNTLKHAFASEVKISLKKYEDRHCLTYTDNGVGFTWKGNVDLNNTEHMGLKNIYHRSGEINGAISLSTTPGNGMLFKLLFDK